MAAAARSWRASVTSSSANGATKASGLRLCMETDLSGLKRDVLKATTTVEGFHLLFQFQNKYKS
jgi:hypothetical protein